MNKKEVRELMKENFVEIEEGFYEDFGSHGEGCFHCDDGAVFFKPKEKFPIKIETKEGYVLLKDYGTIDIFNSYGQDNNCICSKELEDFEEIIKKAKEVRDK